MRSQISKVTPFPALLCTAAFLYLMSNLSQYGLAVAGIPPYLTEIVAQLLIGAALIIVATTSARGTAISAGMKAITTIFGILLLSILVAYLYSSQSIVVTQALVQYLRAWLIVVTLGYAIVLTGAFPMLTFGAAALAVLACLINLYDFVNPSFSQVPGRAAGLYSNPNIAGAILVYLGLIGSMRLRIIPTYILWSFVSLGVAVTFSRSAWLMLVVSLAGLAILGRLGRGRGRVVFVAVISLLLGLVLISLISGDLYYIVARSPLAPFLDANTIARLGASGSLVDDYSSLEREAVLRSGIQAFLDAPVFGNGLGYTLEWHEPVSTHNMFVLFLAERGLVGFLVYIAFMGALLFYTRGIARLLALACWIDAFFTHNQLDLMCEVASIGVLFAAAGRPTEPAPDPPRAAGPLRSDSLR